MIYIFDEEGLQLSSFLRIEENVLTIMPRGKV